MPMHVLGDSHPILLVAGGTVAMVAAALAQAGGPEWTSLVKDLGGWAVVTWIVFVMFTRVERKLDRVLKHFDKEKDDENDDEKRGKQG